MRFDGGINTGLTLRTIRIKDGIAQVRAGATLLFDSDPDAEEKETRLKAAALLDLLRDESALLTSLSSVSNSVNNSNISSLVSSSLKHILLIDFFDSFVHTLGNYLRQTGAKVTTLRANSFNVSQTIEELKPDLVVLSPGPGSPSEFNMSDIISILIDKRVAIFGVCLGLQGIVEHFGGKLGVLGYPVHGKSSLARVDTNSVLFEGLADVITVGRYHSLYAVRECLPECLKVVAETEDKNNNNEMVVMAVVHRDLPVAAVQFHPESILTTEKAGLAIIRNALAHLHY